MQLYKFLLLGIASLWNFMLENLIKGLIGPVDAIVG